MKDVNSEGRNAPATLTLFNAASKSDVLGKADWDFYPEQIAREIIQDDRSVIESGRPIVNKLEVIVDESGRLLWVLTTKTPARNKRGEICGVMGLTRLVGTTDMLPNGYRQFSKVIDYVEEHYRSQLEVSELARIACLSESQFRKRFMKLFKISPLKFITRIRVQTAAKAAGLERCRDRGHRREMRVLRPELPDAAVHQFLRHDAEEVPRPPGKARRCGLAESSRHRPTGEEGICNTGSTCCSGRAMSPTSTRPS